jgi:hypothetical protein
MPQKSTTGPTLASGNVSIKGI